MTLPLCSCENIMTCPMREIGSWPGHCPYDWLAVYDGIDETAPLIGKFCGTGKFPFSIIGKWMGQVVSNPPSDRHLLSPFQAPVSTCSWSLYPRQLVPC